MSGKQAGWGFDWGNNWGGGWTITENKSVRKMRAKKKGGLPQEILDRYDVWKATFRSGGLEAIKADSSYRHEELSNNLAGRCSSRIKKYRIIYTVDELDRKVFVEKVDTHERAYSRRK